MTDSLGDLSFCLTSQGLPLAHGFWIAMLVVMVGLDRILAQALEFTFDVGGVTPVAQPHSTDWRVLPGLMCSQIQRGRDLMHLDDGVQLPVPTGSLMVLPAGVRHRVDLVTPTGLARWVHVRFQVLGGLDLFSFFEIDPVLPPAVGSVFGDVIENWMNQREGQQRLLRAASLRAFGFRLLEILAPHCREGRRTADKLAVIHRLQPVIDHLHRNSARSCDRDQLAIMAGMSPATFHRAFLACTGTTPIGYLRRLRMQSAQRLLISSNVSISEIANQCGYEDPFVFSRAFRSTCGMSPKRYRQATSDLMPRIEANKNL